ncbi:uncharacterized protein LOC129742947 [Uranotaenia lowii]|uniref:uncharacterized protein LOC129742947 n=1 Tax=Uranotaenia lowii TaxID=190385 RepID=UPI00247ADCD4|nr:uncharacterized protein LOC129742947 [Uranotaenia lowii]
MAAAGICCACNLSLAKEDEIVCKGFCRSSFHLKCVNLNSATRDLIAQSHQLFWMCPSCTQMMDNATFRQAIASTNAVIQTMCEEQNKNLLGLQKAVDINTARINEILTRHTAKPAGKNENTPHSITPHRSMTPLSKKRKVPPTENRFAKLPRLQLIGSKTVDPDLPVTIAAQSRNSTTENKFWLYLSGFDPNSTQEQVAELVKRNLQAETADVTKLVPKGKNLVELSFVSFKVGLDMQFRNAALVSSSWQKAQSIITPRSPPHPSSLIQNVPSASTIRTFED